MSQSEVFHETWAYLRDNAKGICERDAAILAELRAPMPPSRAHLKRIQRPRPVISTNPPPSRDLSAREEARDRRQRAQAMLAAIGMAKPVYKASPLPRVPLPPIPPSERVASAPPPKIDKLRRDHMVALAKMARTKYEFDVAEVLEVFGTPEAFFRAVNS